MPNNVRSTLSGGRLAALRWLCLAYALWNVLLQLLAPQADSFLPFIGGALFETVFWLSACKLAAEARAGRTPRLLDALRLLREKSAPRNLIVVLATLLPLWALSFSTLAENHGAPRAAGIRIAGACASGHVELVFPLRRPGGAAGAGSGDMEEHLALPARRFWRNTFAAPAHAS